MSFYGNPQNITDVPPVTVYGCDFRTEFLTMWSFVNRHNLWDTIKEIEAPVMFSHKVDNILYSSEVQPLTGKSVLSCGHSGATEACCFHMVKYVAKNGWNAFFDSAESTQ